MSKNTVTARDIIATVADAHGWTMHHTGADAIRLTRAGSFVTVGISTRGAVLWATYEAQGDSDITPSRELGARDTGKRETVLSWLMEPVTDRSPATGERYVIDYVDSPLARQNAESAAVAPVDAPEPATGTPATPAPSYPRTDDEGRTVWACCDSSIGPVCGHRADPIDEGDEDSHPIDPAAFEADTFLPGHGYPGARITGDPGTLLAPGPDTGVTVWHIDPATGEETPVKVMSDRGFARFYAYCLATGRIQATGAELDAARQSVPGPVMRDYGSDIDGWHDARSPIDIAALSQWAYETSEATADEGDTDPDILTRARRITVVLAELVQDGIGSYPGVPRPVDRQVTRPTMTAGRLAGYLDAIGDALWSAWNRGQTVMVPAGAWIEYARNNYAYAYARHADDALTDWNALADRARRDFGFALVQFDGRNYYLKGE